MDDDNVNSFREDDYNDRECSKVSSNSDGHLSDVVCSKSDSEVCSSNDVNRICLCRSNVNSHNDSVDEDIDNVICVESIVRNVSDFFNSNSNVSSNYNSIYVWNFDSSVHDCSNGNGHH